MPIWHPLGALGCFLMLRGIGLIVQKEKFIIIAQIQKRKVEIFLTQY